MGRVRVISMCLAIVVACALLQMQTTTAKTLHVVGDDLGWQVLPGGPFTYAAWAAMQTFNVGDILLFNFSSGEENVARVTKEAFVTCNSTSPISLNSTGPLNFTLDSVGDYYFICTIDDHCPLGQKLAINVTAPGPKPSPVPAPPRGPLNYTVGDDLGWTVPIGGPVVYAAWAYNKTFMVADTLIFNWDKENGSGTTENDVALVTKEAFDKCENKTNSTILVLSTSPARIALNSTGEHYFTSTYRRRCELGQKLAINVTSTATHDSPAAHSPNSNQGPSGSPSTAQGPQPPPSSSAMSPFLSRFFLLFFLSVSMAFV